MKYKRKQLKCVNIRTEEGFTLLEMLYAFALFCLLASLFPLIFQIIFHHQTEYRLQRLEWEVFINQMKKEVRIADDLYVVNNVLVLIRDDSLITYEKYADKLRRRVNQTGHEVVLQNVKTMQFEQINHSIKLTVTDHEDQLYEENFRSFIHFGGTEDDD